MELPKDPEDELRSGFLTSLCGLYPMFIEHKYTYFLNFLPIDIKIFENSYQKCILLSMLSHLVNHQKLHLFKIMIIGLRLNLNTEEENRNIQ